MFLETPACPKQVFFEHNYMYKLYDKKQITYNLLMLAFRVISMVPPESTWNRLLRVLYIVDKKIQVGKDQEKAQSEKDSHSKNRGGKKPN